MIDSLARHEEVMINILEKALFLSPVTVMNLPGPSFADPIMKQIRNLSPPYVGGPKWPERRAEICNKPGNEVLCAHPFMAEDLLHPMAVREWELLQQQSDAKKF